MNDDAVRAAVRTFHELHGGVSDAEGELRAAQARLQGLTMTQTRSVLLTH